MMRIHYPVINKKKAGHNKTHIIFFSIFLSAPGSELLWEIWASREKFGLTFLYLTVLLLQQSRVMLLMWNISYVSKHIKNKYSQIYKIWYYLIFTEIRNLYRNINMSIFLNKPNQNKSQIQTCHCYIHYDKQLFTYLTSQKVLCR